MTYLRNPRIPFLWESDGDYNGKYRADDGTLHDSARAADEHDRKPKKKPYTPPHLRVYGNIRDMTESSRVRSRKTDHSHRGLKTA